MKRIITLLFIPIFVLFIFFAAKSFAIFKSRGQGEDTTPAASWSVSRNQSLITDSIDLVPGTVTDDYTLTVTSYSEVDITYAVIISNLPSDVRVTLEGVTYEPTNNTIRVDNVGTINYSDQDKTKNHTLTFSAISGAQTVSAQEINIDVEFKQKV
ncbi:MAG: hypothetical protein IKG27_00515 [Bacilli bacterium]|nr:hypothetical protein [Bacilli bacterium]